MPDFKLSFVVEKKIHSFLDTPEESLIDSVHSLVSQYADKYAVRNIELRNDSCPEERYLILMERFKSEIEKLREEGFEFTLHAARAIQDSDSLDQDILAVLGRDTNLAKELGIPLMVTHASFSVKSQDGKRYPSIMHLFPELDKLGKENGIRIAIENISLKDGMIQNTNDHLFILDFISRSKLDNIGIAIDFGHLISCGFGTDYAVKVIETAEEKLFHIHAHETDFGEDMHAALNGKLDWKRIIKALEGIGYLGSFVLEMRSPSLPASLEYLKSIGASFKIAEEK